MQFSKPLVLATLAASLLGAFGLTYSQSVRNSDYSTTTDSNTTGNIDPARSSDSTGTGSDRTMSNDPADTGTNDSTANDSTRSESDRATTNRYGSSGSDSNQDSLRNNRMGDEQFARADRN